MKKKSWSCAFLGMNTLVHRVGALLAVSTLLVLGTFTPVMAKKPVCGDGKCNGGENANSCPADCTSGGDGFVDGEDYIDGEDNVSVFFGNANGRLVMRIATGSPNKPPIRTLDFDFSDCASTDVDQCTPPFLLGSSVGPTNIFTSTDIDLTEMDVDELNPNLRMAVVLNLNNIDLGEWGLRFDPEDPDCQGSSYITVIRTGPDTWEIEAAEIEAAANNIACLTRGERGGGSTFHGLYHMPFKMTVSGM